MRREAWASALRYVAISNTDRQLDVWRAISGESIKFTIHPKKNEIHFIQSSPEYANMTAQHCVGGIKKDASGIKVTFSYRIERETAGEYPILLGACDNPMSPDTTNELSRTRQPICYASGEIDDPQQDLLNHMLRY